MFRQLAMVSIAAAVALAALTSCSPNPVTSTRSANYVVEGGVGEGKRWRDTREIATEVQTESLTSDGIHDPTNAAFSSLQDPAEALSSFPLDRRGGVNWVKAIELGIIEPRADLQGKSIMPILDMDILFKDTGQMPWVKFPHKAHTTWLACSNCHPDIFIQKKGANNPSMDGILAGEHCGRCHDKVAFALWTCERCHNTPHAGTPPNWIKLFGGTPAEPAEPTATK